MADNLSAEDRKKTMQAVKGKGTKIERSLFSMLAGMGISGWRKNADDIVGKPDVVFDAKRVAIFVDGCFWHGCPQCQRPLPVTNSEYWSRKIVRTIERDTTNNATMASNGWQVIRIWEHEMRDQLSRAAVRHRLRVSLFDGRKHGE